MKLIFHVEKSYTVQLNSYFAIYFLLFFKLNKCKLVRANWRCSRPSADSKCKNKTLKQLFSEYTVVVRSARNGTIDNRLFKQKSVYELKNLF